MRPGARIADRVSGTERQAWHARFHPDMTVVILRDKVTNTRVEELHALWTASGRGAPMTMAEGEVQIVGALIADRFESGSRYAGSSTFP